MRWDAGEWGGYFLTEWIRKCFIDEGAFELDLEGRFRHERWKEENSM